MQPNATCTLILKKKKSLRAAMPLSPFAYIKKKKKSIEKNLQVQSPAARDVHGTPHWNLSSEMFVLLRLGAERRRWRAGGEGWGGSIRSLEEQQRSHFQAGGLAGGAAAAGEQRGGPKPTSLGFPAPAEHNGAPGSRPPPLPASPRSTGGLGLQTAENE